MSLNTRGHMLNWDTFNLYNHFKMCVSRDDIQAGTEVWVLRNSIRVVDFYFDKAPSPLYQKMTARELENELRSNVDDINSGRRKP